MILLVSIDDFRALGIVLPVNQDVQDWERYINEAQEFDIRPNLGDRLFYDLLKNSVNTNYQDLLNGVSEYTWQTYAYRYPGLKAAICYFAYARYLPDSSFKNTDFGMVRKQNEYSTHPDTKYIQVQVNNSVSVAKGFLEQAITYLSRYATIDSTKYPLWGSAVGCASPQSPGVRISKIGQVPGSESHRFYERVPYLNTDSENSLDGIIDGDGTPLTDG